MYTREILGLEEARAAAEAALSAAMENPERPVAIAVVDYQGDLVHFVRTDGSVAIQAILAMNKAYTAARWRMDTEKLAELMLAVKREAATHGDPRFCTIRGGLCIKNSKGIVVGAIGVSGRRPEVDKLTDIDLAARGVEAAESLIR